MKTVNEKITDIYQSIINKDYGLLSKKINDLLFSSPDEDLRECGCDLYMLFRFYKQQADIEDEKTLEAIDSFMNHIALYVVSLDKPRLVEIQDNDSLDVGIFVDSLAKLQEPFVRVERKYVTDDYLHFSEFIYKDINGLKYRNIELPLPPGNTISGYELTNGLLMEREENLKLMFEEDEDE